MKKKLAKSKKKAGTSFKDKIIMVVSVAAITISVTSIVTRAAINLNPYPTNPSPLLVSDTIATNPTSPSSPLDLTANPTRGCGTTKDGLSCIGTCYCGTDQYGNDWRRDCVPVNAYKGGVGGCTCPEGCGGSAPSMSPGGLAK